jgi:uncharacterized membrane protein YdfJ with MMPL/SSD domain
MAALLVRLRWWVIGFWVLACWGSLFVCPACRKPRAAET